MRDSLKNSFQLKAGFRTDLGGLRGVAVISVLLFHYFPYSRLTRGGFIGVDIFFVLSGFLITQSILAKPTFGKKEFLLFVDKRIKRLFPALAFAMCILASLGFLLYQKNEYRQLAIEITSSSFFVTNWLYLKEASYFDPSIYANTLLHTWSLAIEGQFYITLPLLLLVFRRKVVQLLLLSLIFLVSYSILMTIPLSQNMKFYGTPTRLWELLGGVIAAYSQYYFLSIRDSRNFNQFYQQVHRLFPFLGITLIGTGFLLINSESNFPGLLSLYPFFGALFIILGPTKGFISRYILKNRFLIFFGEISYSLYLWHWILLSSTYILVGYVATLYLKISLILLSILLAVISTFFIEKPILKASKKYTFLSILTFFFLPVFFFSILFVVPSIEESRKASDIQPNYYGQIGHQKFYDHLEINFPHCLPKLLLKSAPKYQDEFRCYQSNQKSHDAVLIGDSHAEHIFPGLSSEFPDINFVYYLTNSNYSMRDRLNAEVAKTVLKDSNIKTIILNSWWFADKIDPIELKRFIAIFTNANKKVFILNDVPDFYFDPKACNFTRPYLDFKLCSQSLPKEYVTRTKLLRSAVDNSENSFFIDSYRFFCDFDNRKCSMNGSEAIFYRDYNHLNIEGSLYFARSIRAQSNLFLN